MNKDASVTIASNYICFSKMSAYIKSALLEYTHKLISFEKKKEKYGKTILVRKNVYAASDCNRSELRFHINQYGDILKYLKNIGYGEHNFDIQPIANYDAKAVDYQIIDDKKPFGYQTEIIDYLVAKGKTKVINLPTGMGKTLCALRAVAAIKERLLIVILGRYVNKWIDDVKETFALQESDLLVIRGSKELNHACYEALLGNITAKVIICTSTTMQRYIKEWEYGNHYGFVLPPDKFMPTLQIGIKLIDECHQFFHLNYKIDLYTHVNKSIYLSATLEPSDKFLKKMYGIIYPIETRMRGADNERYIDVLAIAYNIEGNPWCKRNGVYSHVSYENEILKYPRCAQAYVELIHDLVKEYFLEKKQSGQKMLIFASTVAMCIRIRDYLRQMITDHSIVKYTAEDNWEELHNNDIVVSTMGSSGTAVDIANLKVCLNTVSISSIQQNIQSLGRLRKLVRYENDNPMYLYLYAPRIERQNAYHNAKLELFKGLCKSHIVVRKEYCLNFKPNK